MYPQTIGACPKCHQPKVQAGDEIKCLRCDTPKPTASKRINTCEDPGEKGLAAVLNNSGITLPKGEKPQFISKPSLEHLETIPNQARSIDSLSLALVHLKAIPVPKDLKQFKKIRKAIDLLESLVGE